MKFHLKNFFLILFLGPILFSCSKESSSGITKDETDFIKSASEGGADLLILGDGNYEKVITKQLVKSDDCLFIVEGTIEFRKDGETVANIDFGDGECDAVATKTVNGKTTSFSLKQMVKDDGFYKVIAEPLMKTDGCDYIVSGTVEFYSQKDDSWLVTIDFGNGNCDQWATKTWEGGSKEFSLKDWKWK